MLAIASKLSRDGGSFQVSTEKVGQFGDRSRNVFGLVVRIDMGCPVDQMEVRAAEAPAAAPKVGDSEPSNVVQAFARSGGLMLLCEPERHRYVVLFGELAAAHHVAIVVPGVGDETNLLDDWLPAGRACSTREPTPLWSPGRSGCPPSPFDSPAVATAVRAIASSSTRCGSSISMPARRATSCAARWRRPRTRSPGWSTGSPQLVEALASAA